MWKNIVLIITVVLAAVAVWLLVDMRGNDTREQFINCKVENVQLTIQYGRCLATLNEARTQLPAAIDPDPGGMVGDPDPGGMVGDPDPGGMVGDPDPGGMITDPDPGGMVGDPDPGDDFAFDPSKGDLKQCGVRNLEFRSALKTCADMLENGPEVGDQ